MCANVHLSALVAALGLTWLLSMAFGAAVFAWGYRKGKQARP